MSMFENFPYTDMHALNLDWIIKIATDFLDQYTTIQQLISDGETSLQNLTDEGLQQLQDKADNLGGLLQAWYNEHSDDIAGQLADAITDLNQWYNTHTDYLNDLLLENQRLFQAYADEVTATIPEDYTVLSNQHERIYDGVENYDLSTMTVLEDTYIDANGDPVTEVGYNTYKIPANVGDVFVIKYDTVSPFWNALNANVALGWEYENEGISHITTNSSIHSESRRYFFNANNNTVIMFCIDAGIQNIVVTSDATRYNQVKIFKNMIGPALDWSRMTKNESFFVPLSTIGIDSQFFGNNADNNIYVIEDDYKTFTIPVKTGDSLYFENTSISGLSFLGSFLNLSTKTVSRIPQTGRYVVPADGFVMVFESASGIGNTLVNLTKRNETYIDGTKITSELIGYDAVAFGTSVTYRSNSYMPILSDLLKIHVDNQAAGNSTICEVSGHPDMLSAIESYASYSNKEIILIEGFVNDWYSDAPLGTYLDLSTEATACGRLRHALNYLQSNKPGAFVAVIFDHYGRSYNGVDCSPGALNANNVTQYTYYDEMAKVCESLGVIHIDLYKIARTSGNNCLLDDIHLTEFGAKRIAWLIRQQIMNVQYPID